MPKSINREDWEEYAIIESDNSFTILDERVKQEQEIEAKQMLDEELEEWWDYTPKSNIDEDEDWYWNDSLYADLD